MQNAALQAKRCCCMPPTWVVILAIIITCLDLHKRLPKNDVHITVFYHIFVICTCTSQIIHHKGTNLYKKIKENWKNN